MNPNDMDPGNGGGHLPHGHHPPPPPEHHGHHQFYDPQTGQPYPPNYNYPGFPYGYYHHDGAPPPHHQYHEGQYHPYPYYPDPHHYGMEHPLNVKAESEPFYAQPPPHHVQENYRMDDGRGRQIEMHERAPPEDKEAEPAVQTTEQQAETQEEQKETQVEPAKIATAPAPEVVETPAESKEDSEVGQEQQPPAEAESKIETAVRTSETLDIPEGRQFPFDDVLKELQSFKTQHGHASIPVSHPAFTRIVETLADNDIEKETDKLWERQFNVLKEYKDKHGECGIPYTDANSGKFMALHRKLKADGVSDPLTLSRLAKLDEIGFEWDLTVWDKRLEELSKYTNEHGHTDVPITHPGGLGIWVINQKFNLQDMPKERIDALDALGFIWNHNRKKRNNKMWEQRYSELLEYVEKHKTPNVPTTAGHSKLSKWVGKQREEYKKFINKQSSQLDRHRIDKLNKIGFQWSLQQWSIVPWEERFEALKKFKEEHGHLKIPRNHPYFGNWPSWQKTQYKLHLAGKESKLSPDKIDKLISIGFFKSS